jgi:phage virion morphogenesis protein
MSIEIVGLEGVQQKLTTLSGSLSGANMTKKLRAIGNMVQDSIEDSFENQASPFGEKWKPLKIRTIHSSYGSKTHTKKGVQTKNFQKYATNRLTLVLSGTLKDTWQVDADATSVTVSGNATSKGYAYGIVHQFGSTKKSIPARPFLPVDASGNLEPKLLKTINDYLNDEISRVL